MQLDFFKKEQQEEEQTTKVCKTCKEELPINEFYRDSGYGREAHIKCDCRDCYLQKANDRYRLKKSAPPAPANCECCGSSFEEAKRVLDHCHYSRTFRGWICAKCNTGLGHFDDNIEQLQKGIEYLRKHSNDY